jgi:hypothetical protein
MGLEAVEKTSVRQRWWRKKYGGAGISAKAEDEENVHAQGLSSNGRHTGEARTETEGAQARNAWGRGGGGRDAGTEGAWVRRQNGR